MNAVRSLLFLLVLVTTTLALLLAAATGVGVLLHRLLPSMDLGAAVLTAVVGLSVSVYFVLGIFAQAHSVREELDEADLEEVVAVLHRPSRRRRTRR